MPKRRKLVPRKAAATIRVASRLNRGTVAYNRVASLLVVQGADVDIGRMITCDKPISIGRDESAEMPLSDGSISRRHCQVSLDEKSGCYFLDDLGSTNGTLLNGKPLEERSPLAEGDKIYLGGSVLRFSFADDLDLQYQSRVEELVGTDPLTGMTSRREYDAAYRALIEKADADGHPLTLMVLDMDGLKQINDTHGHDMGCYVIVDASLIIREILEPHGILCRFGGDEFVACLPAATRDSACKLAENVRDRIAKHNFTKDGIHVEPTISIGVASYPEDADGPATLFAAADKALYRAKRQGRNAVAIYQREEQQVPDSATS